MVVVAAVVVPPHEGDAAADDDGCDVTDDGGPCGQRLLGRRTQDIERADARLMESRNLHRLRLPRWRILCLACLCLSLMLKHKHTVAAVGGARHMTCVELARRRGYVSVF